MAKTRRAPEDDVSGRRPDDEDDAPRRARRQDDDEDEENRPFAPRKKRKSAAGPVKLILRICGGIGLAVLLVILLIWIYSPVGTDSQLTCYLPPETTRISGYDVEESSKNHKLADVNTTMLTNYKQFSERRFTTECGVTDKDVVKFLSGVASPKDPDEEKDLPQQDRRGSITVIRFKRDVDQSKFIGSFTGLYRAEERSSRDGKKYHHLYRLVRVPPDFHEEREDDISFFFPNNRTLVYASTWRECEECLARQPGQVVLEGDMRELASKVDGQYFQASTGWYEFNGVSNAMAFGLGFIDPEIRDQKTFGGRTGTASWFADNGNDFLYASAALYTDVATARRVRKSMSASFGKAQADIWQTDAGRPSGLEDPFHPGQKGAAAGGGGAFPGGGGSTSNEQTKDILEALTEYALTARAYNRGRLVIVEGRIPHGNPEQGIFEKFWRAISQRFQVQNQGFGGFGGPGGFGPPGAFGPPPGMPVGPGMPGGPGGPPPGPRR